MFESHGGSDGPRGHEHHLLNTIRKIESVPRDSIGAHGVADHVHLLQADSIDEVRKVPGEHRIAEFVLGCVREAETDAVESEDLKMLRQDRNVSPPAIFPLEPGPPPWTRTTGRP